MAIVIFACVLLALCALYLFMVCPNLPRRDISHLTGYDYAHRGLWNEQYPENSLPAFARAVEHGFGMEFDVHLTRDGELVVFHDDVMTRMTGDSRNIHTCTLAELRQLRLKGTEYDIPTLREVLDTVGGKTPLIVEIKTGPNVPELCEKTNAMLKAYGGPYCIESFDPKATAWWRTHEPQIIRGTLSFGLREEPKGRRTWALRAMSSLIVNVLTRPDFVAYGHNADRNPAMWLMRRVFRPTLVAWTVRSQQDMDALRGRYDLQIFERFLPRR